MQNAECRMQKFARGFGMKAKHHPVHPVQIFQFARSRSSNPGKAFACLACFAVTVCPPWFWNQVKAAVVGVRCPSFVYRVVSAIGRTDSNSSAVSGSICDSRTVTTATV